jgi:hypothetical protein
MLFLFHTDTEEGQHILAHAPGASASCLDKRTQRSGQGTHGGRIVGSRGGNWRRALAALVALPGHSSPWLVAFTSEGVDEVWPVLQWNMVDNSSSRSKPTLDRLLVMRQSRGAFSSPSEAPSELVCGYLHPSPGDMIEHPIRLAWRSSTMRQQGTREHLARPPSSAGSAGGHGWRPLSIALREQSAPSFARLHEPHPQGCMGTDKIGVGTPPFQIGEQV